MIHPASQKEGRKIVFMNENERPHKKYRIESESEEEVIEQENEDIDKLKSRKVRKNKKQKTQKSVSNNAVVSLRVIQRSRHQYSNILT